MDNRVTVIMSDSKENKLFKVEIEVAPEYGKSYEQRSKYYIADDIDVVKQHLTKENKNIRFKGTQVKSIIPLTE